MDTDDRRTARQPAFGLAMGAVVFLVLGLVNAVMYLVRIAAGGPANTAWSVGAAVTLAVAGILAYGASALRRGGERPFRARNALATAGIGILTSAAIFLALEALGGGRLL